MSTDGDSIRLTNPRRVAPKKTWKNKNDDKIIFDNTMFKKHKRPFNANSFNGSNNNNNNNNNIANNTKETNNNNNNNNKNNSNDTTNNNKNNSFNTNMVQINNTIAPNSNTRDSPRRPFANRTIKGGARPYRSTRPQTQNNNNNNKEDDNKSNNINNGHYTNTKTRFTPKKKAKKKKNNTIVIEKEQLTALVAGDHVEITTKHNQIIDGIVYCSIPQVPPLCIIHHYNPERTKNVYVVALHEISRCIKFEELSQERNVELRPINDENANEILERNLAERKAKMETLNISVDDLEQELFDFLYRTLPNKCEWSGNNITFPLMQIVVMQPYKKLSLNGVTKKNKSVQYVETQLNSFWLKQQQKSNTKTLPTSPRSPPSSNSSKSTPKKKKKKKKSKAAKNQNKHKNKSKNNNVNTNTQKNKNNLLQQQTQQILQQFSGIPAAAAPMNQFNVNATVSNPVVGQPQQIGNNLMNMNSNIINQQLLNNIMNQQQINNNAMAQQIDPQQQQLNNLLLSLPVQSGNTLPNPLTQFTQFQTQIAPQQQLNNNNPQQQQLNKSKDNKQQQQQQVAPRMRRGGGRGNRGRNSNRGNRPHQRGRGGHDRRNHGPHNRNRGRGRNNNRGRGRGRGRGRERENNHHNQQNNNNQGIGRGRNQGNTHNMQQNEIINNISINNQ